LKEISKINLFQNCQFVLSKDYARVIGFANFITDDLNNICEVTSKYFNCLYKLKVAPKPVTKVVCQRGHSCHQDEKDRRAVELMFPSGSSLFFKYK
jgi:hypothetical protein